MPAIKRSRSASASPAPNRSDASSSSSPTLTSATKTKASPESAGKRKSKGCADGSPSKRVRVTWAAEEDVIILDLLKEVAKEHLWAKIKADGRLVHRGSSGIKVHFESMMSKMIKMQGQGGRQ